VVFERDSAVFADINVKQRLIDMIAVPWNQEAEVPWHGEMWREVFRRGAFDGLEQRVETIRVNREHTRGQTVGKLVFADPKAEEGLLLRSKIFKTERGNETLALAEEDGISPSVGYRLKDPSEVHVQPRDRLREILRAFLYHIRLVETPAFAGAQVLAVREDQSGSVVEVPPYRRALDEAWNDPAYVQALSRLDHSTTS
jgi:HK97 family phage prohead protease